MQVFTENLRSPYFKCLLLSVTNINLNVVGFLSIITITRRSLSQEPTIGLIIGKSLQTVSIKIQGRKKIWLKRLTQSWK
jgi:hypothetical protein